ncbi:MAG: cysteine desulfurase [Defluviitaleaceae bacterium]|nr:cysteine desulfurase [Defluviitaleaceae bacterium]
MKDIVYFDNAASTKPTAEVMGAFNKACNDCYGNPSSAHSAGVKAEAIVNESKNVIASLIDASCDEIVFTSGGTESNNMAIFGIAERYKRSGNHIITTKTEHPSVSAPFKSLEQKGFKVTYLDVCDRGYVNEESLYAAVCDDTILVSIHHVNSEAGTIQKIDKLSESVKSKNRETIFHCDGVQAFGKIPINLKNVDLYSMSGHKIHCVKGIGCLYVKKGIKISPLLYGGSHQGGLRGGTENSMGSAAFGVAAKTAYDRMNESHQKVLEVKNRILEIADGDRILINGDKNNSSPYILSMSFLGKKGEVLLHYLDDKGLYVSTGSACNERKKSDSGLAHFGYSKDRVSSVIRFSFSRFNTPEEADYCISVLKEALEIIV